jgi:hypothetical protein
MRASAIASAYAPCYQILSPKVKGNSGKCQGNSPGTLRIFAAVFVVYRQVAYSQELHMETAAILQLRRTGHATQLYVDVNRFLSWARYKSRVGSYADALNTENDGCLAGDLLEFDGTKVV